MSLQNPTCLVIEDLALERERYARLIAALGYDVVVAATYDEAMRVLCARGVDVVLTDLYLSQDEKPEGLKILAYLQETSAPTLALAMSSNVERETAAMAKSLGAMAFLRKPLHNADEIAVAIGMAKERRLFMQREVRQAQIQTLPADLMQRCPDGIVLLPEHEKLMGIVAKNREIPAIIYGETGTGKEEIAKLIHKRRVAEEGPIPFISVNCANLNGDLAVSLLFGHRKGAFSSADRNTVGFVGEADGGILFLDEIHTLNLATQHKLLRVLNDGTYSRLGDTIEQRVRFQVVAASTADLDEEVDRGNFLLDLRTRLTGIDMHLPPLRQRFNEMDLFIGLYFARRDLALEEDEVERLAARARQFYWRGNIRQLYKVLDALVVMAMCNDEPIRAVNMPVYKTMLRPDEEKSLPLHSGVPIEAVAGLDLLKKALVADVPLEDVMLAVEKAVLEASFQRHRKIADIYRGLGIGRNTLDVKRKKHGL